MGHIKTRINRLGPTSTPAEKSTTSITLAAARRPGHKGQVIDIGGSELPSLFKSMLQTSLIDGDNAGKRLLPSPLLSDDTGLKLWSSITHLPDYYQTRDEIELLEENGDEIASNILAGTILIDLGAGDIRKVTPLLDKIEARRIQVNYFALDLSHKVLKKAMKQLRSKYKYIQCAGLWGTFDDGLKWVKSLTGPRFFISLGSIFCNDFFDSAVSRLQVWADEMRPEDRMLVGMDATADFDDIWNSYHDQQGLFEKFMRNGLEHSNRVLGYDWYTAEDWEVVGDLVQEPAVMHRFIFRAVRAVQCTQVGFAIDAGGEIDCYEAFKYPPETMQMQFEITGLSQLKTWEAPSGRIHQYLLSQGVSSREQ